jgi:hypothetical protein
LGCIFGFMARPLGPLGQFSPKTNRGQAAENAAGGAV